MLVLARFEARVCHELQQLNVLAIMDIIKYNSPTFESHYGSGSFQAIG